MNPSRIFTILSKDLKKAPRTGVVFLALLYPVMITGIVHLIFGSIFDPVPRVAVVDHKGSTAFVQDMENNAVDVTRYAPAEINTMWDEVAAGNHDVGMVFPPDFDERTNAGEVVYIEEKLSTRANMQAVFKLEAVAVQSFAKIHATQSPMTVEQVVLTDQVAKSWVERLLPLIILLAFFIAGTFLTGFSIVDENMRGTMRAMLTGPTAVSEVMLAKGIFSFGIAAVASLLTLWMNGAIGALSPLLIGALAVAGVMTVEFGLMIGFMSKDVNTLSGITKGLGLVVITAVMPFMWDGWPVWVSKLNPLWYVISPIVGIVNENKAIADVGIELGIGVALCAVFVFVAKLVATRRLTQLDAIG